VDMDREVPRFLEQSNRSPSEIIQTDPADSERGKVDGGVSTTCRDQSDEDGYQGAGKKLCLLRERLREIMVSVRSKEAFTLKKYFESSLSQDTPSLSVVVIKGPSGSGKSHLAKSLHGFIETHKNGYFLTGSFDPVQRFPPKPFAALVTAFESFTASVLRRGQKEDIQQACETLQDEEIAVLTGMIPVLDRILSRTRRDTGSGGGDRTHRFVLVFSRFLRAICSPQRPIVLLLEDLHWADHGSLSLIKTVITDTRASGLFIVATVCDDDRYPFSSFDFGKKASDGMELEEVERNMEAVEKKLKVFPIELNNLSHMQVKELIMKLFDYDDHIADADEQDYSELAGIILQQTNGNLFYMTEFLCSLEESNLIHHDDGVWTWNLETIGSAIKPCSICDFLGGQLGQNLSRETQEVLKVASCLGFFLKEQLIEYVLGYPVTSHIIDAVAHGYLVPLEGNTDYSFSFAHEYVREAVYTLVPSSDKELFHVEIGRRLWRKFDQDELDRNIYNLLFQFSVGKRLITRENERVRVASLCLHAGQKAAKASAFQAACAYLELGIYLVLIHEENGTCWRSDAYDLTLSLHNAAAEMAMCSAAFERMNELIDQVLLNAKTHLEKVQAYGSRIYVLGVTDRQSDAIDLGIEVLREFGELFPRRRYVANLMSDFVAVRRLLHGKSDQQLMRLPPLNDGKKLACLQILQLMFLNCLLVRPELVGFVTLKSMRIALKHGQSALTSTSFANFGMLCLYIGDVDSAVRCGQLGLKMLDSFGAMEYLPRVYAAYYGVIHPWKYPIRESLEPLLTAHRVGHQTGDLEFAYVCLNCYFFLAFIGGISLDKITQHHSAVVHAMTNHRQESLVRIARPFVQTIVFLLNASREEALSYKGEFTDLVSDYESFKCAGRHNAALEIQSSRMMIAYFFDAYDEAESFCDSIDMGCEEVPTFYVVFTRLIIGMISLAQARRGKNMRKNIRAAKKSLTFIRRAAKRCPDNCLNKKFLLEAELASIHGRSVKAYEKYLCAIAMAKHAGFPYEHALANECAGRHLCELGQMQAARSLFEQACQVYDEWGAKAKVLYLQQEMVSLFSTG